MKRCDRSSVVLVLLALASAGCESGPKDISVAEEDALKAEMAKVEALERNHHQLNAVPEGGMNHPRDGENPDE